MLVKIERVPQGYLIERSGASSALPKDSFWAELTPVESPASQVSEEISPSARLHAILDDAQPAAVDTDDYRDYLAAKYS